MVSDKKQLTKVETKREDPTRCQDKKNFKNVKTEKNTPLLSLSQKKVNSDLDYSTRIFIFLAYRDAILNKELLSCLYMYIYQFCAGANIR